MTNLKKIGLSALAGSLVAFSANAVEMSVTGTAEVTYTTSGGKIGGPTGNPWGGNQSIKFSGSGDVGFGTATIVRTINDGLGSAWLSSYQTIDMGAMGTVSLDQVGGGLEGTVANDDKLPSAYEEVWNGLGSAGVTGAASNDTLGYSNSFGPLSLSLAMSNSGGTAGSSDGGNDGSTAITGSVKDFYASVNAGEVLGMLDGLTIGYGASSVDYTSATADDDTSDVGHIIYSNGPISIGYRHAELQSGTAGSAGKTFDAYSVAFNVNDEMSISLATQDMEVDNPSSTNVTETIDAINISYTMGAASIRATVSDASDVDGVTGEDDEHMELSLLLAF